MVRDFPFLKESVDEYCEDNKEQEDKSVTWAILSKGFKSIKEKLKGTTVSIWEYAIAVKEMFSEMYFIEELILEEWKFGTE